MRRLLPVCIFLLLASASHAFAGDSVSTTSPEAWEGTYTSSVKISVNKDTRQACDDVGGTWTDDANCIVERDHAEISIRSQIESSTGKKIYNLSVTTRSRFSSCEYEGRAEVDTSDASKLVSTSPASFDGSYTTHVLCEVTATMTSPGTISIKNNDNCYDNCGASVDLAVDSATRNE